MFPRQGWPDNIVTFILVLRISICEDSWLQTKSEPLPEETQLDEEDQLEDTQQDTKTFQKVICLHGFGLNTFVCQESVGLQPSGDGSEVKQEIRGNTSATGALWIN